MRVAQADGCGRLVFAREITVLTRRPPGGAAVAGSFQKSGMISRGRNGHHAVSLKPLRHFECRSLSSTNSARFVNKNIYVLGTDLV